MAIQPDDDLIREVYAKFGLAYYRSDCLHRNLCITFVISDLPYKEFITRPRIEERLAQAFSMTLGDVAVRMERVLPNELTEQVRTAVAARNFLAHHFWFERAHLLLDITDVHQLIGELDGYSELFYKLDAQVEEWSERMRQRLGLTDEIFQDSLERILRGEESEPLLDKAAIREVEKKLNRRQNLARVWEFSGEDGTRSLIFELADGSLWQLADIGIGLTRFRGVDPTWIEHPAVKPYLPADIIPRPAQAAPWDYEFQLNKGAVMWVKPGDEKGTFRWGVRAPTSSDEGQAKPKMLRR